ncbi:MAG TPA: general secretion pathway protein GspK [Verrucomicrobiota bacterium]|jgi:general secretion pathway protein K|nr:general secretion pathway protein GspK [Verrucomicrobiota bacterium]HRT07999.1 general secretion pathway protein GspK [Candidatus Paceibacterota bacterium]
MRVRRHTDERGIALIIVMISIFVLTMLAAGFAYSMKVETMLARHASNDAALQWLGRSGVEYCRWILVLQATCPAEPYDSLNQSWAGGAGGPCSTNGPLAELEQEVHLGQGSFTWKITDLDAKANINTAGEGMLEKALMLMGVDAAEMTPIVNSILDWIDPDDQTRIEGTESDYYERQRPPYQAKNGPIDDISELLFIKGVTPYLYWGPASSNSPPNPMLEKLNPFGSRDQGPSYQVGLVDLFTPISSGKININTASAEVLQLIPGVDPIIAEAIVAGRQGEFDPTGLTGPYRTVAEVRRIPEVNMLVQRQIEQFCDVRSRAFRVEINARIGGSSRTFYAIVVRPTPRETQVINFYWKY